MSDADLLEQARKKLRGAARAYARAADLPSRAAALVELERSAVVAVIAAASTGIQSELMSEVLEAANKGLGL